MKRMALYLHDPECSEDCVYAMVHALSSSYQIRIFSEKELDDDDFFTSIDVIAFPGGIGDSDSYFNFFTRRRANRISEFIQRGGCYLGTYKMVEDTLESAWVLIGLEVGILIYWII